MSTSPISNAVVVDFVCDCDESARAACAGEPFYGQHKRKRYCVLHFPSERKSEDFKPALEEKIENEDFDFRGVWFPDEVKFSTVSFLTKVDFSRSTFNSKADFSDASFKAGADFANATFNATARFSDAVFVANANFSSATFKERANFGGASFSAKANFSGANFEATDFRDATFGAEVDFNTASFSMGANFSFARFVAEANFSIASFSGEVNFSHATVCDQISFAGAEHLAVFEEDAFLDLQLLRIEKPDRVSFHTLSLRPSWFMNVDARKFEFTNVDWRYLHVENEIKGLTGKISSPHRMLAICCRNLAVNAEENHRYEEASRFRYLAMDSQRLELWRGFDFRRLSWWYWLASGYGERVLRALMVLVGILLVSAALYTQVGFARWEPRVSTEKEALTANRDEVGKPLTLARALTYSAAVMTFQRPDPRPATAPAQTIVVLETILGPLQAALLALAIRRKFMR